jgi:hypothetical protein
MKEESLDDSVHDSPPVKNEREITVEIASEPKKSEPIIAEVQEGDDKEIVEIMKVAEEKTVSEKLQEVIEILEEVSE